MDPLLDNLGYIEEQSAVDEILRDTYTFPKDRPEKVCDLHKQAIMLYHKIAKKTIKPQSTQGLPKNCGWRPTRTYRCPYKPFTSGI